MRSWTVCTLFSSRCPVAKFHVQVVRGRDAKALNEVTVHNAKDHEAAAMWAALQVGVTKWDWQMGTWEAAKGGDGFRLNTATPFWLFVEEAHG